MKLVERLEDFSWALWLCFFLIIGILNQLSLLIHSLLAHYLGIPAFFVWTEEENACFSIWCFETHRLEPNSALNQASQHHKEKGACYSSVHR